MGACWLCDKEAHRPTGPGCLRGRDGESLPLPYVYCKHHLDGLFDEYREALKHGMVDRWTAKYMGHIKRHLTVAHDCVQAPAAREGEVHHLASVAPAERD